MPKIRETTRRPPAPWDSLAMNQPLVQSEGAQGLLDAVALSTMPVPVVGDVAGLASDAYRFATDPESRTLGNAAWASLGMLPFVPYAGILAGKGAKTADLGKLEDAKKLAEAGEDNRSVWSKTGWFKSPDGEWRFEIDDSTAQMGKVPDDWTRLDEVFSHPVMNDAYPEFMHETGIRQDWRLPYGHASYTRSPVATDRISMSKEAGKPEALHEMQHGVQFREGFAGGGNPETAANAFYDDMNRQMSTIVRQKDQATDPAVKEALQARYDELMSAKMAAKPYDLYSRLAGEAEARAVADRYNMTPEQRRAVFPLDSYDVPLDQLIIRRR